MAVPRSRRFAMKYRRQAVLKSSHPPTYEFSGVLRPALGRDGEGLIPVPLPPPSSVRRCSRTPTSSSSTSGSVPNEPDGASRTTATRATPYWALIDSDSRIRFCGNTRMMPPRGLSISALARWLSAGEQVTAGSLTKVERRSHSASLPTVPFHPDYRRPFIWTTIRPL